MKYLFLLIVTTLILSCCNDTRTQCPTCKYKRGEIVRVDTFKCIINSVPWRTDEPYNVRILGCQTQDCYMDVAESEIKKVTY